MSKKNNTGTIMTNYVYLYDLTSTTITDVVDQTSHVYRNEIDVNNGTAIRISDIGISNDGSAPLYIDSVNLAYDFFTSIKVKTTKLTLGKEIGTPTYLVKRKNSRGIFASTRLEYEIANIDDSKDIKILAMSGIRGPFYTGSNKQLYIADLTFDSFNVEPHYIKLPDGKKINELFDGIGREFISIDSDNDGTSIKKTTLKTCEPIFNDSPTIEEKKDNGSKSTTKFPYNKGASIEQAWSTASAISDKVEPYGKMFSPSSYIEFVGSDKTINSSGNIPISSGDFYTEDEADKLIKEYNIANGTVDNSGSGIITTKNSTVIKYANSGYLEISDSGTKLSNVLTEDRTRTKNMGIIGVRSFELEALDMVPSSNAMMPTPRVLPDLNWVYKTCSAILGLAEAGLFLTGRIASHIEDIEQINTAIKKKNS